MIQGEIRNMCKQIYPGLEKAHTNIVDGIRAPKNTDQENISHFKKEAQSALSPFPDDYSYIEEINQALNNNNFDQALQQLANLCAHIRDTPETHNVSITYSPLTAGRIEEAAKREQER